MALPLLMLAGAGMLGGGQYLLKQMDDRRSESLLPDLESAVANSPFAGTQYGDMLIQRGQSLANSSSLLERNSGEIDSLFDTLADNTLMHQNAQAQQQAQQQAAWENSNEGHLTSIQQQRQANQETFGQVQNQARVVESLYNSGDMSGNNLQGMINAIARMQFPNEALNEGDINRVIMGSPVLAQWQNQIAGLTGGADPELAKSIYNMGRDLYGGYQSNYEAGKRNVDDQIARMRGQGYLPTDRVDRRFGTFDPDYQWQQGAQVKTGRETDPGNDQSAAGFADAEKEANSRGRTLIDPNAKSNKNSGSSRRQRRGR